MMTWSEHVDVSDLFLGAVDLLLMCNYAINFILYVLLGRGFR